MGLLWVRSFRWGPISSVDSGGRGVEPYLVMHSGAAHDTMSIADRVPSAMIFVPCKDGISHSPEEDAEPADAALGAQVMLNAIRKFVENEV